MHLPTLTELWFDLKAMTASRAHLLNIRSDPGVNTRSFRQTVVSEGKADARGLCCAPYTHLVQHRHSQVSGDRSRLYDRFDWR